MKVLLINGSPNRNGCTNRALEEVEKSLREEKIDTEIFQIENGPVHGCSGCNACEKTGRCIHDDVTIPGQMELSVLCLIASFMQAAMSLPGNRLLP